MVNKISRFSKTIKKAQKFSQKDLNKRSLRYTKAFQRIGINSSSKKQRPLGTQKRSVGRPFGTFKYGMPINEYKKLISKQRATSMISYNQQMNELLRKGYSEEQIRAIQIAKRQNMLNKDKEISFEEAIAKTTVSPNTQIMLEKLRRIQGKAKADDANMQRIKREQRMVSDAGNLLKTPNIFGSESAKFNILEVDGNILTAPSVFKQNPDDLILTQRRPSILQTSLSGNDLRFGA